MFAPVYLKNRVIKFLLVICLVLIFIGYKQSSLCAAEIKNNIDDYVIEPPDDLKTVSFDLNGANGEIPSQLVQIGALVEKPNMHYSRENFTFEGWIESGGRKWDFDKDVVTNSFTLYAKWKWDVTVEVEKEQELLDYKYFNFKSCKLVEGNKSKYIPIEMQGSFFPKADVLSALEKSNSKSSYGGCGPIAMIGMFDYFAKHEGLNRFLPNPFEKNERIELAKNVFNYVTTYETFPLGISEYDSYSNDTASRFIQVTQSGYSSLSKGNKMTITLPTDYVRGFKRLTELYGYSNQIKAVVHEKILGISFENLINVVKKSIDSGMPVTMYNGNSHKNGSFADHYVNVYGYKTFYVIDRFGRGHNQTIFEARLNFGNGDYSEYYCDSEILNLDFCGVITYERMNDEFDYEIKASDFAKDFVNSKGQGQYYFYEKTATISLENGLKFETVRKRCGYIEDKYLVLSANRENVSEAYLEFEFDEKVRGIDLNMSLWGYSEQLYKEEGDYVHIEYFSNDKYINELDVDLDLLSKNKNDMSYLSATFNTPANKIRIIVCKKNPKVKDWNRGRIVIDNIKLYI